MTEVIKLNAMNLTEARKRALKVLEINENQILKITEEKKGTSAFFGLFSKEGSYSVEYTLEEIKEEVVKPEPVKVEPVKPTPKVETPKVMPKAEPKKEVIPPVKKEVKKEAKQHEASKSDVAKPMTREEIVKDIQAKQEPKAEVKPEMDSRHMARDLRKEREEKKAKSLEKTKTLPKKDRPTKPESHKTEVKKDQRKYESAQVKQEAKIEVNEEKLAEILTQARNLLKFMELNLEVNFDGISGRNYVINLSGEDKGIIIGKKGKTLNSYEYLLNSLIKDARIDVDVEGFKSKRNDTLVELANKIAIKAIKTRKIVRLNPMPPRERKIIHEIINQYPELDTYSEGREPKRYIIVKVKR